METQSQPPVETSPPQEPVANPKVTSLSEEYLQNIAKFAEGNLKRRLLYIRSQHNSS